MIRRGTAALLLAASAILCATVASAGEPGRSLPFNKQTVYNYLVQTRDAQRKLPENIPPAEYDERVCQLFADQLKQAGYDFEATVQKALQFSEHGNDKLNDPRFMALRAVMSTTTESRQGWP